MAAGDKHACALSESGRVWCWGYNAFGQLGNGATDDSMVPVNPTGLGEVNNVAVGAEHSCARAATGAVYCWGQNLANQLGDTTTTNRLTPISSRGAQLIDLGSHFR